MKKVVLPRYIGWYASITFFSLMCLVQIRIYIAWKSFQNEFNPDLWKQLAHNPRYIGWYASITFFSLMFLVPIRIYSAWKPFQNEFNPELWKQLAHNRRPFLVTWICCRFAAYGIANFVYNQACVANWQYLSQTKLQNLFWKSGDLRRIW
jgi:hypothetical protein